MLNRAIHPGAILKQELNDLGVTPTALARQIAVPPKRLINIIYGKRAITGDTALRLGHWFGTEPQFWVNLQGQFDLAIAEQQAGRLIRRLPTRGGLHPEP